MTPIVIDSSVYVSYFSQDVNTPQTEHFWESLKSRTPRIIVPSLVVAETLVSLSKQKISYLDLVHKYFKSASVLPIDQDLIDNIPNYLDPPPKLKASDFLIALISKLHSATLITWDKRLLDNPVCPTLTPNQYIISQ